MANEFLTRSEEVVDGTYRLGAVVSRSVRSVVYETEAGTDPAVIKLREAEPAEAERQAERWKDAMKFTHPNLLRVYGAGMCILNDAPVAYVVMERADESLAGVLSERSLSEEETTEMLGPALSALAYLHKNGYAHGSVKASNVMAAGDKLKLASDSAVRVADGGSTAEDMRALGALVEDALPESKSPVFTDIVGHCLEENAERRWTVEQVEKRLYAHVPRIEAVPAGRAERVVEEVPSSGMPKWIPAGLAALVLLVALTAAVRHFAGNNVAPPPAAPVAVVSNDGAPVVSSPSSPEPARIPPANMVGRKAGGWSVIVAAYGSRAAAEKRMQTMARNFTGFSLSVQQQKAERARYLVVLGKGLSENDAETLRKRAVGSGLPRDTYIKKLM